MADLIYPNNITPGTAATAQDVQENFDAVELFVDTQVVHVDGTKAMTAPLTLAGDPTQPNHAANKNYVDDLVPIGTMWDFAGITLPAEYADNWALCDGSEEAIDDVKFAALYAVIGYTWGGSGGVFNLPDYRDKSSVGAGTTFAVGTSSGQATVAYHDHEAGTHVHPTTKTGGVLTGTAAHTHPIDHNHAAFSTPTIGAHGHGVPAGAQLWRNNGSSYGPAVGSNMSFTGGWSATGALAGDHSHSIDVPPFSGSSLGASGTNASHGHGNDISIAVNASTGTVAYRGDPADTNYHPVAACLKIIYLGAN